MSTSRKILFQLSGSIACYKACELISKWVKAGHQVKVACTESALQFIGKATLEGLTGSPVVASTFQNGEMMSHIHLIRWCDFAILAPATANTINNLAHGFGNDIVSTLFLAHDFKKPYYIAPAMNEKMLLHPATQESLNRLSSWGVTILDSDFGELACGEQGMGRLLDPEKIDSIVFSKSKVTDIKRKKLLITSGGTKEPIDGVRFITNMSTGHTGARIADLLSDYHDVTLISAFDSIKTNKNIKTFNFSDFVSLEKLLKQNLETTHFDAIIHLAAVSDFSVKSIYANNETFSPSRKFKLNTVSEMNIQLKKNPKLIENIKANSLNKNILLFGFKLTNTLKKEEQQVAIQKVFKSGEVDFVVHNDLNQIGANQHIFSIYYKNKKIIELKNVNELAKAFIHLMERTDVGPTNTESHKNLKLKPSFFHLGANK